MARRTNKQQRQEGRKGQESAKPADGGKPAAPADAETNDSESTASAPAPAQAPKRAEPSADALPPLSMPAVWGILGSFAAMSLLALAFGWGGYQIDRHTAAAERALEERRHADAIPHLQYVTQRYPKAWMRLTQLGDCLLEAGRADEAINAYKRSLEAEKEDRKNDPLMAKKLDPQDLRGRMGRAQYLMGNIVEASKLLEAAIKDNPGDPQTSYYIGLVYMKAKEYLPASYYLQAATGDPELREKCKPLIEEIRAAILGG